jgi:signal transduction histidine kinase
MMTRLRRSVGSLRTHLIFWNVVALSLLLGGLGIVCRFVTLSFMMQSVDRELERGIGMFRRPPPSAPPPFGGENHSPPGPGYPGPDHGPPPFGREGPPPPGPDYRGNSHRPPHPPDANNPYRPHLFNTEGKSEWPGDKRPVWDAGALTRALRGETLYTTVTVEDEPVRVLSAPGFDHQGRRGAVQNAYPLTDVYRAVSGIDAALLLLIPVGLLGAGWVGVALTNRVLKRVQRMTQAARRIGAVDFTLRLPVSGDDEFSELAETFNGLLGRLDRAFQEQKLLLQLQRRFTADASHELKTPLTIIKGRASLALGRASTDERSRRTLREIDEAACTMSQLVQDLLLLARSDEGQMGRDPMDLLVREVLESARAEALQEGGAPMVLEIEPEELSFPGNEAELVRLFRNLLDNAVYYTSAEERITVTAHSSNGNVVVTVEDTGTGIAPEHLPHLGERFYRVDASRTRPTGGTGLGLSICRSIVEAHHGTLTFESVPGIGTTVTVTLPGRPL